MAADSTRVPLTTERLEELLWQTIRGCSRLEDRIDHLQRELTEAQERIREHESRLNDMYLWVAAIGEDMLERTSDDAARHAA